MPSTPKRLYRAEVDFRRLFEEAPNLSLLVGREATAFLGPFDERRQAVVIILPVDGEAAELLKEGTWTAAQVIRLLVPKLAGLLGGSGRGL